MYNAELILIVDESGSMMIQRASTIASINELVQEQKRLPGDLAITLVTFSTSLKPRVVRQPANSFVNITPEQYFPDGSTALLDSVCDVLDTAQHWTVPPGTDRIVAIITDGDSNADKVRRPEDVKQRVQTLEGEGWKFVFLGSGIDAYRAGVTYGISRSQQVDLTTQVGTVSAYRSLSQTVASLRAQPAPVAP